MVDVNIRFFGWNYDPITNADKVWGFFDLNNENTYVFWGRRGKTMQFQKKNSTGECWDLAYKKESKGYERIRASDSRIDDIFPEFVEHLKSNMFDAKMMDKIRGEGMHHMFPDE